MRWRQWVATAVAASADLGGRNRKTAARSGVERAGRGRWRMVGTELENR